MAYFSHRTLHILFQTLTRHNLKRRCRGQLILRLLLFNLFFIYPVVKIMQPLFLQGQKECLWKRRIFSFFKSKQSLDYRKRFFKVWVVFLSFYTAWQYFFQLSFLFRRKWNISSESLILRTVQYITLLLSFYHSKCMRLQVR
jgi:hypothetical protein